jgi:hypothetical protein
MTDMNLSRRRFVALALPLAVGACSGTGPVLYTIATPPGPTFAAGPKIVMLREIGLASYLDRKEIGRSRKISSASCPNDWWGDSLSALLARVLIADLSQRLRTAGLQRERRITTDPMRRRRQHPAPRHRQGGRPRLLAQVAVEFNRPRRTAARNFTIPGSADTQRGEYGRDQRRPGRSLGGIATSCSLVLRARDRRESAAPVTRPQLRGASAAASSDRARARRHAVGLRTMRHVFAAPPRSAEPLPPLTAAASCCLPWCGSPC